MSRAPLMASAVSFLQDSSTASSPLAQRIGFLESKGLTPVEIQQALAQAQAPQQMTMGGYRGGANGMGRPGLMGREFERDWRDWFIMGVVGGAVGWVAVGLARVSHASWLLAGVARGRSTPRRTVHYETDVAIPTSAHLPNNLCVQTRYT